ncbi:hypothetical protein ANCDUO_16555, partial [Ancylostoma duodenale]
MRVSSWMLDCGTASRVLTDYDLPHDKVTRIVCSGLKQLLDDDDGCVVDKQQISSFARSQLRGVCNASALFRQCGNGLAEGECPTVDGVVPAIKQITHALNKDSLDLGALAGQLKDVVTELLASITDVNHEEFDGTYIQATALNPQLAVLLSEQQLSYERSAIEQELHSRQPPAPSSLGVDALLASVLSSSPDSLPLYSDLLQQAQRLQQ